MNFEKRNGPVRNSLRRYLQRSETLESIPGFSACKTVNPAWRKGRSFFWDIYIDRWSNALISGLALCLVNPIGSAPGSRRCYFQVQGDFGRLAGIVWHRAPGWLSIINDRIRLVPRFIFNYPTIRFNRPCQFVDIIYHRTLRALYPKDKIYIKMSIWKLVFTSEMLRNSKHETRRLISIKLNVKRR